MKNLLSTTVFLISLFLSLSLALYKESKSDIGADVRSAHDEPRKERRGCTARFLADLLFLLWTNVQFSSSSSFFFDCPKTVDTVSLPKYFHRVFRWAHANTVRLWFIFPRFYLFLYVVYMLCIPYDWIWLIKNSFASPPKCIETSMEYFYRILLCVISVNSREGRRYKALQGYSKFAKYYVMWVCFWAIS